MLTLLQTKGLSLEEVNGIFNDTVAVRLTNLTGEERDALDNCVLQQAAPAKSEA